MVIFFFFQKYNQVCVEQDNSSLIHSGGFALPVTMVPCLITRTPNSPGMPLLIRIHFLVLKEQQFASEWLLAFFPLRH